MNFLAHAFLSGDDPDILFGNFVADSIKGKMIQRYSGNFLKGIELHRAIDTYTDEHAIVRQSVSRLQPQFRKFAPVITDIYYDHFLAANWHQYSQADLTTFSHDVYKILLRNHAILPPRSKRILPWMIAQNWLVGYANLKDLQRVFNGMSRRTKFDSGMDKAVDFLQANYTTFEDDFRSFFPHLERFCRDFNAPSASMD